MSSRMTVSPIVLRGCSASPRLWFVRILENEPVPDYAGRNRRTNAAIAAPIPSGLSSWMKWAPATVRSVWIGPVRQKSRLRPVFKIGRAAGRERVDQYVWIEGGTVSFQNNKGVSVRKTSHI